MKWKIESIHHKASGSFDGISDRVLTQVCYTVSISGSGHEVLKQAWVELPPPVTSSFTAFIVSSLSCSSKLPIQPIRKVSDTVSFPG